MHYIYSWPKINRLSKSKSCLRGKNNCRDQLSYCFSSIFKNETAPTLKRWSHESISSVGGKVLGLQRSQNEKQKRWQPRAYFMELPSSNKYRPRYWILEAASAVLGDKGVLRIREVHEIENRDIGRLHCTKKWNSQGFYSFFVNQSLQLATFALINES